MSGAESPEGGPGQDDEAGSEAPLPALHRQGTEDHAQVFGMTPYKSQAADKRQSARERRSLRALPVSEFGEECYVATGGQRIRVNVRWGTGVPLVLCNGIGASLGGLG